MAQLKTDWDNTNTDNLTPEIGPIYNYKILDANAKDYVTAYSVSHEERPMGLHFDTVDYKDVVRVDIRTAASRDRLILLRDEVRRIVYKNRRGIDDYKQGKIINVTDHSDRLRRLWWFTVDVQLWKLLEDITGTTV